jgi:hypothetical protein
LSGYFPDLFISSLLLGGFPSQRLLTQTEPLLCDQRDRRQPTPNSQEPGSVIGSHAVWHSPTDLGSERIEEERNERVKSFNTVRIRYVFLFLFLFFTPYLIWEISAQRVSPAASLIFEELPNWLADRYADLHMLSGPSPPSFS